MRTPTGYPRSMVVGFTGSLLIALSACTKEASEPVKTEPATAQRSDEIKAESTSVDTPMLITRTRLVPASEPLRKLSAAPAVSEMATYNGLQADLPLLTRADESREQYQHYPTSPVHAVAQTPVSTFSIDVDTGSYANVRRMLNQGQLPPADAVRLEELVNYFSYDYPRSNSDAPFALSTELAQTPWNPQSYLLRVAIKAQDLSVEQLPAANLVFLVDVSGSMDRQEGLPLVQSTLKLLVDQLRPEDRVALVVYAGQASAVLPSTSGANKAAIRAAIEQLRAGGSTAGESAIELAYQQAQAGYIKHGINRILLATDGDFNVGVSDFEQLKQLAATKRQSGVSLTTLGFGTGNYNERLMEQLADAGNGNYAYIDNLREARKVLVDQLSSTLATVASDVKIQLEFNPAEVSEYRLLGYENRALKREDFSNDKVDAGEVGAGHSVTALYEIVPVGNTGWLDPLRYQQGANALQSAGSTDELALLRLRYKTPGQSTSRLLEVPVSKQPMQRASDDLRFAAAVGAFAQQLQGGQYTRQFSMQDTAELARGAKGDDRFGLRSEFIQLVELANSLQTSPSDLAVNRVE